MPPTERSKDELLAELVDLGQQVVELRREKTDRELLFATNVEHSDLMEDELFSQLDLTQKTLLSHIVKLRREISGLHEAIYRLQGDKTDLELLLEMSTKHADSVEEDLLNIVETTVRESERRFRIICETIPVPITVSQAFDHTLVYANEPACALFGISQDTLPTHKLVDFYPSGGRQRLLKALAVDRNLNNYELQGYKPDGTFFYGALYTRPLRFNDAACLLCAIYDMTERKQAEDEIRILNEKLEARVQKRTQQLEEAHKKIIKLEKEALEAQMAGGFAHEMRNALVGATLMLASVEEDHETLCQKNSTLLGDLYETIISYLPDTLHKDVFETFGKIDHNEEMLDNMLRQVNHSIVSALGVTALILEYARLGRATVGQETVDVCDVIERILKEHHIAFAEQGITLRSQLARNALLIGHKAHFYAIINNILLNARDELIAINDGRDRFIEITLRQTDEALIIMVTDNANGISNENLPKIFDPFFSTKPATGTGLGLSFVSKLVPLYNGTIDVHSTVDEGTTFTLTFPVNESKKE